jgi:hypothetical protein
MPLYPDEALPRAQLSLRDFTIYCQQLYSAGLHDDFIRLALGGRLNINDEPHRVFINARQDAFVPESYQYDLLRDYDSAIGISNDFPFTHAMAIYPLPNFADTWKKSNHLSAHVFDPQVSAFQFYLLHVKCNHPGEGCQVDGSHASGA